LIWIAAINWVLVGLLQEVHAGQTANN